MSNILIFRTDRIGDLLVSCPAIVTIKKYIKNSKITLVTSKKNHDYAKKLGIFDEVCKFPEKNFFKKLSFVLNLIKNKYDYVYIFDGKERSIITTCLIKSKYRVGLVAKIKPIYNFFNIKFFRDSNETTLNDIFQNFLSYTGINIKISNFDFLKNKKNNNFSTQVGINNYLHMHLDEKWFSDLYIKKYTDICPDYSEFSNFLDTLNNKEDILITTGLIDFNLIAELKTNYFSKIYNGVFIKKNGNKKVYLVDKPSFEDLESLLRNSKTLIACHGAIVHAANSLNVKKIDILEQSKLLFYRRFTSHMNDYDIIYRSSFNIIKKKIFELI